MGGGITGVELASELSKRILDAGGRKSPRITACEGETLKTVTIIEPGERLLPKLKESTSKIVTEHLEKQKVEILTNAVIKGAEDGYLRVKVSGKEVKFKATIAVWTCGVKSDELAMRSVGHNNVTGTLALPSAASAGDGDSTIFAIGDCNNLLPKSAQNAKQQGAYLASYFNSGFHESTPRFEFNSQGTMIRLADRIYMDSPVYKGFLPLWVHRVIIGLDI
jgi:NADH dehydrogenase